MTVDSHQATVLEILEVQQAKMDTKADNRPLQNSVTCRGSQDHAMSLNIFTFVEVGKINPIRV